MTIPITSHHRIEADGVQVFYREAGPADAPVVLLLHGFPTSFALETHLEEIVIAMRRFLLDTVSP